MTGSDRQLQNFLNSKKIFYLKTLVYARHACHLSIKNYKSLVKNDILHIFRAGCAIVCMSTGTRNPEKKKGENAMFVTAAVLAAAAVVVAAAAFIIIIL